MTDFLEMANLKDFPFDVTSTSNFSDHKCGVWAGYQNEKRHIESIVSTPVLLETSIFQFIYGDYGVGKTHIEFF